jgi:hypothetical protein
MEALGAQEDAASYAFISEPLLDKKQRGALIDHVEKAMAVEFPKDTLSHDAKDFKMTVDFGTLADLIGAGAASALAARMGHAFDEIKLRRVEAHGQCINFHLDYACRTMQVLLNDPCEFSGSNIVFARKDGFSQPHRVAGSATIHNNRVAHGVSKMKSGVRYSLFLLSHSHVRDWL